MVYVVWYEVSRPHKCKNFQVIENLWAVGAYLERETFTFSRLLLLRNNSESQREADHFEVGGEFFHHLGGVWPVLMIAW